MLRCIPAVRILISETHTYFMQMALYFFFITERTSVFTSSTSRDDKCHTLYVQKAHFIAYYNSLANVLLFMNNRIICCSTPRRRDDSVFLFCVKPMLYPLPSRPIVCMLSILSCCLCHFPALFLLLPVWYDLHVLCQAQSLEFRDGEFITDVSLITDSRLKKRLQHQNIS